MNQVTPAEPGNTALFPSGADLDLSAVGSVLQKYNQGNGNFTAQEVVGLAKVAGQALRLADMALKEIGEMKRQLRRRSLGVTAEPEAQPGDSIHDI